MTAGEAAKTENREQGINQQIHADRQANGGKLTGQEKKQINHERNGASRQIYRQSTTGCTYINQVPPPRQPWVPHPFAAASRKGGKQES